MKNKFILLLTIPILVFACTEEGNNVDKKKEQLKAYKAEMQELKLKIAATETELMELDSTFGKKENNAVLITAVKIVESPFEHKIDVRGAVASKKNILISPETSGKIQSVNVKEGQKVSTGQTLAVLDSKILRNSITEVKTSLELATTMFEKQEKLFKQNIGTEVQYLQAKNNKESLEAKLSTLNAQLAMTIIKAPFAGVIDQLNALEGEMAMAGQPLIRMVNPSDVYIKADVSERYISNFANGDQVEIFFPTYDETIVSTINAVGSVINSQNRTFEVEVNLPNTKFDVKPNQVVIIKMKDYENNAAYLVPTKVIQKDNDGNFVYIIKEGKATKAHITTGKSFSDQTEVLKGLELNTLVANKGYRELAEGVAVRVQNESTDSATKLAVQ